MTTRDDLVAYLSERLGLDNDDVVRALVGMSLARYETYVEGSGPLDDLMRAVWDRATYGAAWPWTEAK